MGHQFTISELGLKLIKAYEGFRPDERLLLSGDYVIGHGHRVDANSPKRVTKSEAETLLLEDLKPIESLVNDNVHAPLSQGQFDALCSLAFNIGETAFLGSTLLHALNNGRPLDAANGFDVWRKSKINGVVTLVDALLRRRTAEKALFLRPVRGAVPINRVAVTPYADLDLNAQLENDPIPVLTVEQARERYVDAPYEGTLHPARRREDGPSGAMSLSEIVDDEDMSLPDNINQEVLPKDGSLREGSEDIMSMTPSVIYDNNEAGLPDVTDETSAIIKASEDVSRRLDALIEASLSDDISMSKADMPTSLIQDETFDEDNDGKVVSFRRRPDSVKQDAVKFDPAQQDPSEPSEENLQDESAEIQDNADVSSPKRKKNKTLKTKKVKSLKSKTRNGDSASRYIEIGEGKPKSRRRRNLWGYFFMMILGAVILGGALGSLLPQSKINFNDVNPLITTSAVFAGGLFFFGSLYYYVSEFFRRE